MATEQATQSSSAGDQDLSTPDEGRVVLGIDESPSNVQVNNRCSDEHDMKQDPDDDSSRPPSPPPAKAGGQEDVDVTSPPPKEEDEDLVAQQALLQMLGLSLDDLPKLPSVKNLESLTLEGFGKLLKTCKNVIVMSGAGISTSCGIPDFRSPGTGLYDNLQKYQLPNPQAIFELNFFKEKPEPFFELARELWPGNYTPSPTHQFIKLLHDKGILLRHYTQNIDGLAAEAGVPDEKQVAAHGHFRSSTCLTCGHQYSMEWTRERVFGGKVPRCTQQTPVDTGSKTMARCDGLVKPDIVFFGEGLPPRFRVMASMDFQKCDMLIVMGTSLAVAPFNQLINAVPDDCPRMLINRDPAGRTLDFLPDILGGMPDVVKNKIAEALHSRVGGFLFDNPCNKRDLFVAGNCDDTASELAKMLGWGEEFRSLLDGQAVDEDAPKEDAQQVS